MRLLFIHDRVRIDNKLRGYIMDVKEITIQLKKDLEKLKYRFLTSAPPEDRKDRDYFQMVKEETVPVYQLIAQWEEDALSIVKERKANVHPNQVVSTRENMELLLMHSFYMDTRKKRYMELYRSILYVFDLLLEDIEQ